MTTDQPANFDSATTKSNRCSKTCPTEQASKRSAAPADLDFSPRLSRCVAPRADLNNVKAAVGRGAAAAGVAPSCVEVNVKPSPGGDVFTGFVDSMRARLRPCGELAEVIADLVIVEAWQLRKLVDPMLENYALFGADSPKKQSAALTKQAREALAAIAHGLEGLTKLAKLDKTHAASAGADKSDAGNNLDPAASVEEAYRGRLVVEPQVDLSMEIDRDAAIDAGKAQASHRSGLRSPFFHDDDASEFREPRFGLEDECDGIDDFDDSDDIVGDEDFEDGDDEAIAAAPIWSGRLVFDTKVSDRSPVVRGTWVTAGQVVTFIVDGWTWAEILRAHPELSEDDIRACLAYVIDQDVRDDVI